MPTKTSTKNKSQLTDTPKPAGTAPSEQPAAGADEPDFFEQLQRFTADDWQGGLKTYVYRTWPVIDRRDEAHFLAKISEQFDEDHLLRHFGSGKYYLRLNNRRGETLASKTVSIHNRAFPPRVSPGEVVESDPRNEAYFKAWPAATQPPPPADTGALQELSKLATKVLEQRESTAATDGEQASLTNILVNWALAQTSKDREASDPTRITALLKELKSLMPQQQQPADSLTVLDKVLGVLQKLNATQAKPEMEDPLQYVNRALSLVNKLQPRAPAIPAEDGSSLASVAAIVREVAGLIKDPLSIGMQAWAASKARAAGTPPAPRAQAQPTAAPAPTQPGAAQPSPTAAEPSPPPQGVIALANAVTPVMMKWLHADSPGAELGADFAEWVADGWGFEDLRSLQEIGGEGIIDLYRQSPLWIVLAPMEAKFQDFVRAFVAWRPTDSNDKETDLDDASQAEVIELG